MHVRIEITEPIHIRATPREIGVALQLVKKLFFDKLAEVKGAAKTNKPNSSAYRWYGRVRFAQ